jgi:hypothetical protein
VATPKTAASALYPHLPSAERPEQRDRGQSVADAMFPSLTAAAKAGEARQAQARVRKQRLLAELREIVRR